MDLTRPLTIASTDGREAGVWDRLMDAVTKAHDGKVQMIDSSIVREHQHAYGVKERVEFVVLGEVAPARQGGRARPPGSARRRPASRINRARTAAGRLGERATSKRSLTAVETLLTFCPPGPEAPMNSSLSFDSGDIDDVRHAQQSDASAVPRLPPQPYSASRCFASTAYQPQSVALSTSRRDAGTARSAAPWQRRVALSWSSPCIFCWCAIVQPLFSPKIPHGRAHAAHMRTGAKLGIRGLSRALSPFRG